MADSISTGLVVSTSMVALLTGVLIGAFSVRGHLISPELRDERRRYTQDPVESDESDVDEDAMLLDHAPNWANGVEADQRDGLRVAENAGPAAVPTSRPAITEECKLVLVVRTDLGMTKGKIAAQCSHATLACYKTLAKAAQRDAQAAAVLRRWERLGQAKIAVQIRDQEEMLLLLAKARSLGVTAETITDAGRTQIEAGSMTVLGVGPAPRSKVDEITGHLKLL